MREITDLTRNTYIPTYYFLDFPDFCPGKENKSKKKLSILSNFNKNVEHGKRSCLLRYGKL